MRRIPTSLTGVAVIEPRAFEDPRGYFVETYHEAKFNELGIFERFVQDNHSHSVRGTLRGLHYQVGRPQAKLCRVIHGAVLDIVVDIRRGSPTFGRHVRTLLSAENKRTLYIEKGFAHGFLALTDEADFIYKCSDYYSPVDERGIAWNDPRLAIGWDVADPLLSERDRANPALADIDENELPVWAGRTGNGV